MKFTFSEKVEHTREYWQIAERWRKEGNLPREESVFASMLSNYLTFAVEKFENSDAALEWLRSERIVEGLENYFATLMNLVDAVDRGEYPDTVVDGISPLMRISHLASLLGEHTKARQIAAIALRPDVQAGGGSRFWPEYARVVNELFNGQVYQHEEMKLKGEERYWIRYIELMEAAMVGEDLVPFIVAIDEGFEKRNRDKRLNCDFGIESSGHRPLKWDMRRDGVLALIDSCDKG